MATGEYIAAMSHDDISLPHRLSTQIEAMQRDNLDVCFSWAQIIDGEGQPTDHALSGVFNQPGPASAAILEKLKSGNFLLAPSVVCRRECYYHFAWNVALFGLQDYALWLQMLRRYRARVLEIPLVKYRVHDNNVSLTRFSDDYRRLEALAARCLADAPLFPRSPVVRAMLARGLLSTARRVAQNSDCYEEAYVTANRAVNLDPTALEGYDTLAAVLSAMGHDEAARIVRSIGQRVDKSLAYPLPLLAPPQAVGEGEPVVATHRLERIEGAPTVEDIHSTLPEYEEGLDYLLALLRQNEEERNLLRDQIQRLDEERHRLQAALCLTERERDALASHLRAVASGRIMRLLNTITGLLQRQAAE
jgi:tetratricopeptide (TPR) repeat protein